MAPLYKKLVLFIIETEIGNYKLNKNIIYFFNCNIN
jgi:hypothetical protein